MGTYSVSVKELCEYSLMSGSIDNRFAAGLRMQEGIRLHQYVQKTYGEEDKAEYSLNMKAPFGDMILNISGRADGILKMESDPTVEEIKSTRIPFGELDSPQSVHLAQCKIYAYMYALPREIKEMGLKITYVHVSGRKETSFNYRASLEELQLFFNEICTAFIENLAFYEHLVNQRNQSISQLRFPFAFRRYQKETINYIYRCIQKKIGVFMNAPTGSGKTLNTIYPSVKALPTLKNGKIFYLTAKSTQKAVAINAMELLAKNGLRAKSVEITAKEKSCMLDKPKCNPRDCPYALDYYDKYKAALREMLSQNELMTREVFREFGERYKVCPFELSLDASNYADIIVCDYNYVFDPHAALKRYFEASTPGGDYIFLADEAHNLPERSRAMYSEEMSLSRTAALIIKAAKLNNLSSAISALYDLLAEFSQLAAKTGAYIFDDVSMDFTNAIARIRDELERFLDRTDASDERYSDFLDYFYELQRFSSLYNIRGKSHVFYYDKASELLRLFCADAREYLSERLAKGRCGVFFSATLTPLEYYREILGGKSEDKCLSIDSIFNKDNFRIAVDTSIETTFARRALYYKEIAKRIHATITSKEGNYIVYFPSYSYMQCVYEEYKARYTDEGLLIQKRQMKEKEREHFLSLFTGESSVTAFAVIGGVFGEAVDLVGDKLIGVVICGVSLPLVCVERELIKNHFDSQNKDGFDYAYVYPGMNKVLQAMGRVIRTSDDKGCAVLLDARFKYTAYRRCFPPQYDHMIFLSGQGYLEQFLKTSPGEDGFYYM